MHLKNEYFSGNSANSINVRFRRLVTSLIELQVIVMTKTLVQVSFIRSGPVT